MDTQEQRAYDAACRLHFVIFFIRCFLMLNPGRRFEDSWCTDAMAYFATRFMRGEFTRGVVNVPPRYAKSQMFNVALCAFILGHDPKKKIFCISYAGPLANEHAAMFRDIVESAWYQRLFPKMRIKRAADNDVYTTKRGYRRCTSVGGSMTGMGGDIFIVDDPIKPIDCRSQVKRDAVNEWLSHTLLPRLDSKVTGQVLIIMQRLHLDDPSGYVLRNFEGWHHLCLPVVAREPQEVEIDRGKVYKRIVGDVLNPAREGAEILERVAAESGASVFAAHYLQDPIPEGGAMLSAHYFRFYVKLPELDADSYFLQSWDCAAKQGLLNSFSVCTTWLVHKQCYYLVDVFRKKMTFPQLVAAAESLARRHEPRFILIEDASSGSALADVIGSSFPGAVHLIKAELNKELRLYEQCIKFEQGRVFFPNDVPWLRTFLQELRVFPEGTFSDQVDSLSQALKFEIGYDPQWISGVLERLTDSYLSRYAWAHSRGW